MLYSIFNFLSKIFFAFTIIFIPFRWRIEIWSRPMPPLYGDYTDYLLFASDIALIYTLVLWGVSLLLKPKKIRVGHPIVWISLIGLIIASVISVLGSVDTILTRYHIFRLMLLLLFYLYVVNEIQSSLWVIVAIAFQVMIQTPIAIGQSLAQSSLGLQSLGELLLNPQVLGTSIIPVGDLRFLRAYGLTDHPNILGGSLAFSLVIIFAVILYGKNRQSFFASVLFLFSFPALVMTFSRSAWLALMISISFMVSAEAVAGRWNSIKKVSLLGILSLVIISFYLSNNMAVFQKRLNINTSTDVPMQERAYLLQAGNTLFVEHSAIGVGLGATPLAMKKRFEFFPGNYQPPHYVPLLVALETGVVGGIFYLILFLFPWVIFIVNRREFINQPYMMGALALLFAVSVVSFFDYYTWYTSGRLWQWLAWSMFSTMLVKENSLA